jgi:hypothetical protein
VDRPTEAGIARQLWGIYAGTLEAECELQSVPISPIEVPAVNVRTTDLASIYSGTQLVRANGFANHRPGFEPITMIDSNRFDGLATAYAGKDGLFACPTLVELDLGTSRLLQSVQLEWLAQNPVTQWTLSYWDGVQWQPIEPQVVDDPANYLVRANFVQPVESRRVRLTLEMAAGQGVTGIRQFSLFGESLPPYPGKDVALAAAGAWVEDSSPPLYPSYRPEVMIDGNDLDEAAFAVGGPDQQYPHWVTLNFNQQRLIRQVEIQWYARSFGRDWDITYFAGTDWHLLKAEKAWQPTADYLYRYELPVPVRAEKIRLTVHWASGGRMVVQRFSVYGE